MARLGYHASHEQFTPRELLAWLRLAEYADLGCSEIHLRQVGRNQEAFIEAFGAHVLLALRAGGG